MEARDTTEEKEGSTDFLLCCFYLVKLAMGDCSAALLLWQIRPLWQRHNYLQPVLCSLKMPIEFSGSAVCTYFELKHFTARNVLPFLRSISQPQLCAESCSLQVPSLFLHLDMYAHSSQALVQQFILVMHLMGYKNLILFRSSHLSSRRHDTNS